MPLLPPLGLKALGDIGPGVGLGPLTQVCNLQRLVVGSHRVGPLLPHALASSFAEQCPSHWLQNLLSLELVAHSLYLSPYGANLPPVDLLLVPPVKVPEVADEVLALCALPTSHCHLALRFLLLDWLRSSWLMELLQEPGDYCITLGEMNLGCRVFWLIHRFWGGNVNADLSRLGGSFGVVCSCYSMGLLRGLGHHEVVG